MHCMAAEEDGSRRSCDSTGSICLKKRKKARRGSWASTQVECRKCDRKHRSVVPMGVGCGRREHLANQIFGLRGRGWSAIGVYQGILSVAERRARCQGFVVKFTRSCLLGAVV